MVGLCENSGNVTQNNSNDSIGGAGGICGFTVSSGVNVGDAFILGCSNSGTIQGTQNSVGGIVGHGGAHSGTGALYISNCNNSGNIIGNSAYTGKFIRCCS